MKSVPTATITPAAGVPEDPTPLRWSNWTFPVVVAVVTVGVGLFAAFALPRLLGDPQWLTLGDAVWTVQSAQRVSWGALGTVYSINDQYLPLPGFLIVLAPFVALGNHLGYVNPFPVAPAYPTMWIVVVPVFLVTGSMSILGADYLADTLRVTKARRRLLSVAIAAFVVLPTCLWAGHPEDLLALGLSCVSVALLLRSRPIGAALGLMLAIMMQPWALLLIPTLIVATPAGRRLRVLVYAIALPALTAIGLLATDFHDAFRSLVLQPMQGHGQKLPWWDMARRMTIYQWHAAPDPVRIGSTPRLLAVVTAIAIAVAIRRDVRPGTVMLSASVALVARGAFETQIWCWYLAPAAVFLALSVAAQAGSNTRRWTVGALCVFAFYGFAAGAYDQYSLPPMLGLGLLLVTAAGALVAADLDLHCQWAGFDLSAVRPGRPIFARSVERAKPGLTAMTTVGDGQSDIGILATEPLYVHDSSDHSFR